MRALEARLVEDVRALRAAEPTGAIFLLVPSRLLGLHLRRRLARALGGVVNLHVLTLPDLADRVAGLALAHAGRRPLPAVADRLVLERAIQAGIPPVRGYFSAVARLPNFPAALGRTLVDLKRARVGPGALAALAGQADEAAGPGAPAASTTGSRRLRRGQSAPTPAGEWRQAPLFLEAHSSLDAPATVASTAKLRELADVYAAAEATLAELSCYDASDLLAEAARVVAAEPARLGAAAILVFGFLELNPVEQGLLEACEQAAPLTRYAPEAGAGPRPPAGAVEVVAAPGEEREVREIARVILAHAEAGGRFDEVGILLRQPGAYRAAIRDVFEAGGLPYAWGAGPALAETRAGRTLRLLVEARRSDFAREAVIECLAFADLRPGPGVSPAEWDRLSRRAGIVHGAREWLGRLDRLARGLAPARGATARPPAGPGAAGPTDGGDAAADLGDAALAAARERDWEALAALHRVVRLVTGGLGRLPSEGPVATLARRLATTFRRLVRPSPEAGMVLGALAGLEALADLAPRVTLDSLWALVDDALAAPAEAGPEAVDGRVFVGELGQALGLDFPLLILPGLVEGAFPAAIRQDPILLDDERRRLPGLPLAEAGRSLDRLRFLVAVGSGARRVLLTYPRVDAESGRPRVPSLFLLDLVETLTGRRQDFESLESFPGWRSVPLQPAPPAARARPVDEREWLVSRALDARAAPGVFLAECDRAARGFAVIQAREHSPVLTPFDGLLGDGVPLTDRPMAATWLERYATCPFQYFLGRVLGVRAVEAPERVLTLEARERGSLVHAVLETAYRRLSEAGLLPLTPARLDAARVLLDQALDAGFAEAEGRGVTGLPTLWAGERARLRAEVHSAMVADAESAETWVPILFEAAFGLEWREDSGPALTYPLPDGTTVRLAGLVDRMDRSPDGARARVIDYKTGRVRQGVSPDRLWGGRALQLPVYRLAAGQILATLGTPAEIEAAEYYHVIGRDAGRRVRFTRAGWETRQADFDRVLALAAEGIRAGRFFPWPRTCARRGPCEFDLACGAERLRWAEAKAADPAAQRHAELEGIP